MIFEVGKNPPKMTKVRHMGRPTGKSVQLSGRRHEAVPAEGQESDRNWQESAPEVLHAPAPARGAADLKASPHAADLPHNKK